MATLTLDFLRNYRLGTYRESEPVAYQYDQGHVLDILVPGAVASAEVQYWTRGMAEAAAYEVGSITQQTDGSYVIECNVPNEFFDTWGDLRVYLVVTDDSKYVVTYEGRIRVMQREKPEDYVDDDPDNEALRILTEAREAAQSASADADRAAQVAASIPADYSELSGDVSDLTGEVGQLNERLEDKAEQTEVNDLKSAINDIHQIPEGGTFGQILTKVSSTDYDVQWSPVGMPSDAQVDDAVSDWLDDHPEATTTVEDGAVTVLKLNDSLQEIALISEETDSGYSHGSSLSNANKIVFIGNQLAFGTAKYANKTNVAPNFTQSGTNSSVAYVSSGHFITFNGTCSVEGGGSYNVFGVVTAEVALSSGDYKFILNVDIGSSTSLSGNKWDLYCKYNGSSSWTKLWADSVTNSNVLIGFTAESAIKELRIRASVGNGSVYNGYKVWCGIYPANAVFTDTGVVVENGQQYTYSDASLLSENTIDTMQHQSTIVFIKQIKSYIEDTAEATLQYITPEMFGAVGDGVADDTTYVRNCISSAITNGKTVRGYNTYKITQPLTIDTNNQFDIHLQNLYYTGNDAAVYLSGVGIHFTFNAIESAGKGIVLQAINGSCYRHVIEGVSLNTTNDSIYINDHTYYSTFRIRRVNSVSGNCITFVPGTSGSLETNPAEHVFYDFTCGCPTGWVAYYPTDSKFYNFTVEGNCYYGVYDPNNCMFIGWRCREQMDKYERKLGGISGYDAGPLFKFITMRRASRNYINTADIIRYPCLDVSELTLQSTYSNVTEWVEENWQGCRIDSPIVGSFIISGNLFNQPLGKGMIFAGKRIIIPQYKKVAHISTAVYDIRPLDGNSVLQEGTIINMPTCFIAENNATIYLSASYNAIAFNDFYVDTSGYNVTIYDHDENEIFDSTNYQGEKFRIECIANSDDPGRYGSFGSVHAWVYDGTNHIWDIHEI